MEQFDTKRLETAIAYLQRIAEGKNPVNNMPMEEDAVLNNPNVIRCMYFVKEVLEEVRRNEGFIGTKPKKLQKKISLCNLCSHILIGKIRRLPGL